MSTDTGAALAAAIGAAPDDDAPWLVYADWLQEAGRDAEAAAIRAHLPELREPVRAGYDPAKVVAMASVHPPGGELWEIAYGRPPAPPPEFVDALPTWPDPPHLQVERPTERRAEGSGLQYLAIPMILVGMSILRAMVNHAERPPAMPVAPLRFPDDIRTTVPKAGPKATVPGSLQSTPRAIPWDRAEVAGYTFRRVDGGDEAVTYAFADDGSVTFTSGLPGRPAVRMNVAWAIEADGAIEITALPSSEVTERWRRLARLVLMRTEGTRYEVKRDGRAELYVREGP
jgi:uncharacterized protein (TIGR02996 family)